MEEQMRAALLALGYPVAWGSMGQGTDLPRIVLQRISGSEPLTLDGAAGVIDGRVQVDVYGASYGQAITAARQVRALLSGYAGGALILCRLDAMRDRTHAAGGDVIQGVSLDFAVRFRA